MIKVRPETKGLQVIKDLRSQTAAARRSHNLNMTGNSSTMHRMRMKPAERRRLAKAHRARKDLQAIKERRSKTAAVHRLRNLNMIGSCNTMHRMPAAHHSQAQ